MRVLIINEVIGHTSTGVICSRLAEDLMAEGNEVKIAFGRDNYIPGELKSKCHRIGTDLDVAFHGAATRLFDVHGLCSVRATKAFLRWADRFDPQVLWLHNLHGYYLNYELLFSWIKKRPDMEVKWTLHDCWSFTGHCAFFSHVGCNKWKSCCSNCYQKTTYPRSFFADRSESNFERKKAAFTGVKNMVIITPGSWLAELVQKSFLSGYEIEITHNSVDRETFYPVPNSFKTKKGIEGKKLVLGVASVWELRKGLDDFVSLAKKIDRSKYQIVIVGLSSKQIRYINKKAPGVIGLKRTENAKELAEIYTAADVFVNPTYDDIYPTVNLEAEACGTPVITYNTAGTSETVRRADSMIIEPGVDNILKALDMMK